MFQSPMLRSQSSMRLPMYAGIHSTVAFASSSGGRSSSTEMNQSSESAEDQRRVAAPAVRVAVLVEARLDEQARSPRLPMIWSAASTVESPCSQP